MRVAWLLFALVLAVPAAGDPDRLRFNPFAVADRALAEGGATPSRAVDEADGWQPVLRATLRAGDESLVDFGGVLLGIGESHRGWRLLEVDEFEASFERQGERVVLPVSRDGEGTR